MAFASQWVSNSVYDIRKLIVTKYLRYICLISFTLGLALANMATAQTVSEIDLNISANQVVNQPLIGIAQVRLLDSQSNLVDNYDLEGNPVTLLLDSGQMVPSVLNDSANFNSGVIDLSTLNISYRGLSGIRSLSAANDELNSMDLLISFNGYDILNAFDVTGNQISTVYSGLPTTLNVALRNGGSLRASTDPYVKAFFTSDISGSVKRYFSAQFGGVVDTIGFLLENTLLQTGADTLVLLLVSEYEISGSLYQTADTMKIPVNVLDPASFAVVPGSMTPSAAYEGPSFDLSFRIVTSGFDGDIDSTFLTLDLVEIAGSPYVTTIYSGSPEIISQSGDTLFYQGLSAMIDSSLDLESGEYKLRFDYRLISGSNIFILTDPLPASLTVLERPEFGFVSGSLTPGEAAIDQETQFEFTLTHNLSQSLIVESGISTIDIIGDGFSTRTSLVLDNDTIPGHGGTDTIISFTVKSERVLFPASLLGQQLSLVARIFYREPMAGNSLLFQSDFDSALIEIVELPSAQIISLDISAINNPRVNTNQLFQIVARVASQSQADIRYLPLKLSSDGVSVFDSISILPLLRAFDTASVVFDITAGEQLNSAETFLIEIISDSVDILPAIDNTESVRIDLPADMMLNYTLSESAADGLLEQGESFNFVITWSNSGTAPISSANYRLTTQGLALIGVSPIEGTLTNDTTLVFFMTAPDYDTTVSIVFELLDLPVDLNINQPAPINQPEFAAEMEIVSIEADLLIEYSEETIPLIVPGEEVILLEMSLTNTGTSPLASIELSSLQFLFSAPDGQPVDANAVLNPDQSGLYEINSLLSRPVCFADSLSFAIDEYLIEPGQSKQLRFRARILTGEVPVFNVSLTSGGFGVAFADERLSNLPVSVETVNGLPVIIERPFQSTGSTFAESFIAERNPFNPNESNLRLAYVLNQPSRIELRIFSLIGELVYVKILPVGSPGTDISTEPHLIDWDGTNDNGATVLNGVYIAQLTQSATGEVATIKIAVVK